MSSRLATPPSSEFSVGAAGRAEFANSALAAILAPQPRLEVQPNSPENPSSGVARGRGVYMIAAS